MLARAREREERERSAPCPRCRGVAQRATRSRSDGLTRCGDGRPQATALGAHDGHDAKVCAESAPTG
eukprot:4192347-Prymnesium_polylepis.1